MKQQRNSPRRAAWLLLAAAALPATPLLAQDVPVTQPPAPDSALPPAAQPNPVVTQPDVAPPPVQTTEPVSTASPPSTTTPTPTSEAPAARETRTTQSTRTTRTTTRARAAPQPRPATPVRTQAAAATAPAAPSPAAAPAVPVATTTAPAPAATSAPLPVPPQPATTVGGLPTWTLLIGAGLLLLLGFALFNMWRHRRRADAADEVYYDEPVAHEAPVAAEPVRETYPADPAFIAAAPIGAAALAETPSHHRETLSTPMGDVVAPDEFDSVDGDAVRVEGAAANEAVAVAEDVSVAEPDPADVEALAASSTAPDGRPWLEFLMRPVRAGTSDEAAVVEFELTVGNTGSAPARDVRISTFMFPAGSTEMERMLIEPPAHSAVEQGTIGAGEATRVEGQIALPRETIGEQAVLPVVVADARYTLPDGSEGRTRASFEVGIPSGHGLDPFPVDRISGLLETVEARLHGEPERV